MAVTARDVEVVRWLARHRVATAEQVMRRFGMQRSKAYQRLRLLESARLIRFEPGVRSSRLYLATSRGMRAASIDLPRATVSPASCVHDLAVVDVAIPYERDQRFVVHTERELRRLNDVARRGYRLEMFAVPLGSSTGCWPDLVVEAPGLGERRAIEVELTLKKADRIRSKLSAYLGSTYTGVLYIVRDRTVARAVEQAGRATHMSDRLRVRTLRGMVAAPELDHAAQCALLRERLQALESAQLQLQADLAGEIRRSKGHSERAEELVRSIDRFVAADKHDRRAQLERWSRSAIR